MTVIMPLSHLRCILPAQSLGRARPPQVDPLCLTPKWRCPFAKEWIRLPLGPGKDEGVVEMLPAPLAIAALLFHPSNWPDMHKQAQELKMPDSGVRVHAHPFSCDEALRCQAQVDAKPREPNVRNLLVGLNFGDDKTDVERMSSAHAVHLKLLNTGREQWYQRQSKLLLALLPIFKRDEDAAALDNTFAAQRLYQRALSLLLVLLEVCARFGIKVTHRYGQHLGSRARHMPMLACVNVACATHMRAMQAARHLPPVAAVLAVVHRPRPDQGPDRGAPILPGAVRSPSWWGAYAYHMMLIC